MSTGKVVLGTVAGVAVGAVLGVLFAPEKGSVTRQQIADKGNEYADELKSKYREFADSIAEKFESTKEDLNELADNAKAKYIDVKNEATNAASSYKL